MTSKNKEKFPLFMRLNKYFFKKKVLLLQGISMAYCD